MPQNEKAYSVPSHLCPILFSSKQRLSSLACFSAEKYHSLIPKSAICKRDTRRMKVNYDHKLFILRLLHFNQRIFLPVPSTFYSSSAHIQGLVFKCEKNSRQPSHYILFALNKIFSLHLISNSCIPKRCYDK